jgi:hypothetical protein
VAQACNPGYSEGNDEEYQVSKPGWTNSSWDPISIKLTTEKGWGSDLRCRSWVQTPIWKNKQTNYNNNNRKPQSYSKIGPEYFQLTALIWTGIPSSESHQAGRWSQDGALGTELEAHSLWVHEACTTTHLLVWWVGGWVLLHPSIGAIPFIWSW